MGCRSKSPQGAGLRWLADHLVHPLIDCDYDAATLLFDHLYQPNFTSAPAVPSQNNLLRFDQTKFSGVNETKSSMHSEGYVYVPMGCATDAQAAVPCRLHVAFHGCGQS